MARIVWNNPHKPANDSACCGACAAGAACQGAPSSPPPLFLTVASVPAELRTEARVGVISTRANLAEALLQPDTLVLFLSAQGQELPFSMRDPGDGRRGVWGVDFADGYAYVQAPEFGKDSVPVTFVNRDKSQTRYRAALVLKDPPSPGTPPVTATPANRDTGVPQQQPPPQGVMVDAFFVEALARSPGAGLPDDRVQIASGYGMEIGGRRPVQPMGCADLGLTQKGEAVYLTVLHTPQGDVRVNKWALLQPGTDPPVYYYGRISPMLAPGGGG